MGTETRFTPIAWPDREIYVDVVSQLLSAILQNDCPDPSFPEWEMRAKEHIDVAMIYADLLFKTIDSKFDEPETDDTSDV